MRSGGRRRPGTAVAGALAACALVVSACGVTTESDPQAFATQPVPTVAPPTGRITQSRTLFLVKDDRLVSVDRQVPEPVSLHKVLQVLLDGPTTAEGARGLRSAIPSTLQMHRVSVHAETATIDLSGGLAAISTDDQPLALAQLVYTATDWRGVSQVRILVEGVSVQVPRADGTLTEGVVTRTDYAALFDA